MFSFESVIIQGRSRDLRNTEVLSPPDPPNKFWLDNNKKLLKLQSYLAFSYFIDKGKFSILLSVNKKSFLHTTSNYIGREILKPLFIYLLIYLFVGLKIVKFKYIELKNTRISTSPQVVKTCKFLEKHDLSVLKSSYGPGYIMITCLSCTRSWLNITVAKQQDVFYFAHK